MTEHQRTKLRHKLRALRDALDADTVKKYSAIINKRVHQLVDSALHVAGYYPLGNEVDLSSAMSELNASGKTVYVPMVLPENRMQFAPVDDKTPLTLNRYGIKEPQVDSKSFVNATALDAVLVPLVGFDKQCNRMGMGGGYYDRCFAHRKSTPGTPVLIGVAFETQLVDSVFAESWDVPLDYVATESRVLTKGWGLNKSALSQKQ